MLGPVELLERLGAGDRVVPVVEADGDHCYTFSVLGNDAPLYLKTNMQAGHFEASGRFESLREKRHSARSLEIVGSASRLARRNRSVLAVMSSILPDG